MNKLDIISLTKKYKTFNLSDVTFSVPCGSVVGLIGENGAGKSTLIRSILGCVRPDGGKILFEGKQADLLTMKDKQKIAFVLDDTGLPMELDLKQLNNVLCNIFISWDSVRFFDLVKRLNLPDKLILKDFSKGMKMKTAIAVSLSYYNELLILDEPTSGLDSVVRDEIIQMLYDYIQNDKKSVLISSHISSDLEKLCDYIVFLHEGKVAVNEEKDMLLDKYVIVPYSGLEKLKYKIPARVLKRDFGSDALIEKKYLKESMPYCRAGLDDIMLFYSKGEII